MPVGVRRVLLALLLILGLAPGLWFYRTAAPASTGHTLQIVPLALPPAAALRPHLGAFTLEGAWQMTGDDADLGGYSALLPLPGGRLMAIDDYGRYLTFSPPGAPPAPPRRGEVLTGHRRIRYDRDTESATRDPVTGTIWIGREDSNSITRHDAALSDFAAAYPPAMKDWEHNNGAEAMARLADGRFVVLAESFPGLFETRLHPGVMFPRDPLYRDEPVRFLFAGSPQFSPTDMAELPDGRVLILMRRLVWPFPLRFAGRIMIADPAAIRAGAIWHGVEVAKLSSTLPVDNFEGMAIVPRADGRVTVWLISDKNSAATQRSLLWKLAVDPARLPGARKKARERPRAFRQ